MKRSARLKAILLLTSILFLSFTIVNEDPKDRINVKGPLSFGGTSFKLAWTAKPKETYYIQEYLPEGEQIGHFTRMLTIYLLISDIDVKDVVATKIKDLTKRKETDPSCNYVVNESPDGKEFMLDFLVGESKENEMTISEFNVYRYKQIEVESGKKAIMIFAFSKRAYNNEITTFLASLRDERGNYLNQMIATELPAIRISND